MKKIVMAVMATVMLIASSICVFGANDTSNVGMETKLYAQYKAEEGGTYTVRFVADVAYDANDVQYADYKQFGFWCSNSSYFSGDNYLGSNIYKTIMANGVEKEAENGYFIVFEIKGVTADANLYVQPVCKNSNNAVTTVGEKINVTMEYIIENAAEEEETTSGGGGSGEGDYDDVITDGMSLTYECYDSTQMCAVIKGSVASGNVTIPSTYTEDEMTYTVAAIEQEAFLQNTSLVSMTLPGTIQYISDNAFMNCYSLTKLTIAPGPTSIGTKAFYCCSSLQEITIPSTVTIFGSDVFGECTNLKTIYVANDASKSAVENALSASGVSCNVMISASVQ